MVNHKRHILIAEDDYNLLCSMRFTLRCSGYHVTTATNGVTALQKILDGTVWFDLLVTDVQMPLCSGVELLERLNRLNVLIPVIAISAYDDYRTMKSLSQMGCRVFLCKPFTSRKLNNCIDNIFNNLSTITHN